MDEMPAHQLMELKKFDNGGARRSAVVVYHAELKEWRLIDLRGADIQLREEG